MKALKFLCKVPNSPVKDDTRWVAITISDNIAEHHLDTYMLLGLEIQRAFRGSSMSNIRCDTVQRSSSLQGHAYCIYYLTADPPAETIGWRTITGYPFES